MNKKWRLEAKKATRQKKRIRIAGNGCEGNPTNGCPRFQKNNKKARKIEAENGTKTKSAAERNIISK